MYYVLLQNITAFGLHVRANVNKKLLLLAGSAAVIAAPAHAREGQPYVGIDAGFVLGSDIDIDLEAPVEEERSARIDRGDNLDIGVVAGYDFGPFRLEADLSRRAQSVQQLESITPAFRNSARVPFGVNTLEYGHSRVLALMLNGLFEFGSDDGLTFFAGGGVGVADVNIEAGSNAIGTPIDDSSTGFAYQGLAGARVPVSDDLDFGVKYRYFRAQDVSLVSSFGAELEPSFETHSFLASLVYNFGAPTPPPPPPPPPSQEPTSESAEVETRDLIDDGLAPPDVRPEGPLQGGLIDLTPESSFDDDPLIDDPVTGAGNEDFWVDESEACEEGDDCAS